MKSILFITTLTALISLGCRYESIKSKSQEVTGVRLEQVSPETLSIPVLSTGVLISSEEIKLSFKTGGIVAKIKVKEGDRVKKGDILAILNLSEISAQVNLASIGYDKASRDYTRVRNLYTDSVATLEQMQNAATALSAAKSTLDIARFNLAHSEIIAPENGVILKQFVNTNELIASGYPVFLFGTSGKNWKVKTGLSDRDIVRINPGDSAIVTLDAWQGKRFKAIVDQVGEMANPLTGTFEIEMTLDRTSYRLATGFIAAVEIFPSKKENFMTIPVGAIVEADGENGYVYFVSDSMIARKIKIEIVTLHGSKAAIKGNLNGIREIVSEGAAYLRDGIKVRIVK
jgi:membrane fusion protein, multidrug efflux system